ncbi:MAG: hypothetical protein LBR72_02975 [Oscillospiraceae bacterium]|jgi:hypothetical protein|nr:hypothetical protein [Oscillospiraceae bacterium]
MFAVLEVASVPRRFDPFARGFTAEGREKPSYLNVTLEVPLGARKGTVRRRARHIFEFLRRAGIIGIVLPEGFPYAEEAAGYGLAVSTPVPLLRRLAAPLCRYAVETAGVKWDRVRVLLFARRATNELINAASALTSWTGNLHILAGPDSEAVCYLLRKRFGVAASDAPVRHSEGFLDVVLLFECPEEKLDVPDDAVVLNLTGAVPALTGGLLIDGAALEPPRSFRRNWPVGCDNGAMLAALLATEQVLTDEIGIRGLTLWGALVKL